MSTSTLTFDEFLETVDKRKIFGDNIPDEFVVREDSDTESTRTSNDSSLDEDNVGKMKEIAPKTTKFRTVQKMIAHNVITRSSGNDSDDNMADNEEENSSTDLTTKTKLSTVAAGNGDGHPEYNITSITQTQATEKPAQVYGDGEVKITPEPIGLDAETEEGIERVLKESQEIMEKNARKAKVENAHQSKPLEMETAEPDENIMGLLRSEIVTQDFASTSSDGEESESTDEEMPFYEKLDKSKSTEFKDEPDVVEEGVYQSPVPVKTMEDIRREIPGPSVEEDKEVREMLTWESKAVP
ncbi:hypothetical protein NQ318_005858 [Aromia moschata]|uniref:Uncharacterized protein n=1 Tax=Aromia moschata TaxID=1265417 RepID=A0AAV8YS87_9CUCU|nr:hypothetical protein NQ318_005858 [Aromia moschata]